MNKSETSRSFIQRGARSKSSACTSAITSALLGLCVLALTGSAVVAADAPAPAPASAPASFDGEKTSWHGYDRYDFTIDQNTLEIKPTKAQADEGTGIKHTVKGLRRAIIIVPKVAAPGNPWSWRGCYWDYAPSTEIELLKRGYCIGYVQVDADIKPDQTWDAWYDFLTTKHGLSTKPSFLGMSRGGEYSYMWATTHPDKVSCIYADNPGGNIQNLLKLGALATNDVPLLHICGSLDPIIGTFTLPMEQIYHGFGGRMTVMIKEGKGHHPHSLRDIMPIADWIEQNTKPDKLIAPPYAGARLRRTYFYSLEDFYRDYPAERTYITCRGPGFVPCYNRYTFDLPGVEAPVNVIAPNTPAPGMPWVFRNGYVDRDAAVDLALLAKGYHIVTTPSPYNADGPLIAHWNLIYQRLTENGFSKKPVMEGNGPAAGEAYAWAVENPGKVSCLYALNPIMHSNTAKTQPLDNLAPLAQAGVPLLNVCGSLDPWTKDNSAVLEDRYKKLGGQITVIVDQGRGHLSPAPADPQPVVDFILSKSTQP